MSWKDYFRPDFLYDYFFMKRLYGFLGGGDALVLVPYSDGVIVPKRGYYEKHLVGNLPGYVTEDGDIYVAEGWGNPQFSLFGIPSVLALNPSEHSSVMDPLKSLIAHKREKGEFLRVDQQGDPVEVGEAVEVNQPTTQQITADGGQTPTASPNPTDINYEVYDGLFDLTPPMVAETDEEGDYLTDEEGNVLVKDQADGWIISQMKAADLVPSKTSSSELKLMQQRERNAMADSAEMLKYILFGAVGASIMWLIFMVILGIATGSMPSVV